MHNLWLLTAKCQNLAQPSTVHAHPHNWPWLHWFHCYQVKPIHSKHHFGTCMGQYVHLQQIWSAWPQTNAMHAKSTLTKFNYIAHIPISFFILNWLFKQLTVLSQQQNCIKEVVITFHYTKNSLPEHFHILHTKISPGQFLSYKTWQKSGDKDVTEKR